MFTITYYTYIHAQQLTPLVLDMHTHIIIL